MKALNILVIAALLAAPVAHANNMEALLAGSQNEIANTINDEKKSLEQLINEVVELKIQIKNVQDTNGKTRSIRNTSFLITGGLAVATGLLAAGTGRSDLRTLGWWLMGTGAAGAGTLFYGGKTIHKTYKLSVEADKLEELSSKLTDAEAALKQRRDELEKK